VIAMRIWMILGLAVLLAALAGCSGGGNTAASRPLTATPNELDLVYTHRMVQLPQQESQHTYRVQARLWMPLTAPLMTTLSLALPYGGIILPMTGPLILSQNDGANQGDVPIALCWGSGDTMPADQPQLIQVGGWMPGYQRPAEEMYIYQATANLSQPVTVTGAYAMTADENYARRWQAAGAQTMFPTAKITEPIDLNFVLNVSKPAKIAWDPVPGAIGYLVNVEADYERDGKAVGHIVWISTTSPVMMTAVFDLTPYLMPPGVHEVTIPANIFRGCNSAQVSVLSYGQEITDTTTSPWLHIVNLSITTKVFATIAK